MAEALREERHVFIHREGVLTAWAGDGAVLYDAASERYLALNSTATRIWQLLAAGTTADAIVEHLHRENTAPREEIARDVMQQIVVFQQQDLIAAAGTLAGTAEIQVPSIGECWRTITALKWLLWRRGFGATIHWIRKRVEPLHASTDATTERVRECERIVAVAASFFPGRARCLEQSLALYLLMRKRGVAVTYCQGARPWPFQAHAWIEYRGEVINDIPEHTELFPRFEGQLP
jgi:hypothetical protein